MDEGEYFERLETTAETPSELFEHFEVRSVDGRTYHALPDARHGVERGTVLLPDADAVVRGYPSVPRVLVLDPGVESFFTDGDGTETVVAVEEKLDGFNVRIADVGDDGPLAFTRGGYVCPYTTARARELLDLSSFFADHPETMLCAELIGPETPYTTHDYDDVDSHAFRVFGVRDRGSGDPLPVAERRDRCERYGFESPQFFGQHDPSATADAVADAIERLDAAGREGVVMKSADGERMVKYTTESQHHDELAYAFSLPFDYGRDFVLSRVVREAFQAAELDGTDERRRERARDLGESILLPMVETIQEVSEGGTVGERHTVRGESRSIDALLDHLRDQSLTLDVGTDRRDGDERVVEFLKVAESTQDRVRYYLDGGTRDE
jgi:putative ATP-dependent DNA ligase